MNDIIGWLILFALIAILSELESIRNLIKNIQKKAGDLETTSDREVK